MKPDEQCRAMVWLKERYQGCPHCGSKGGAMADLIALPILDSTAGDDLSTEIHPSAVVLPVACKKCGFMMLFNAKTLLNPEAKEGA